MTTTAFLRLRGVSLVELMVAMTIGLLIMIAVGQAYLNTAGSARVADAQAGMNEDAQTVLAILVQQLKLAGANPIRPDRDAASLRNPATQTFTIRACDTSFTNVTTAAALADLGCAHTAASPGPDALAVSYEADKLNTSVSTGGAPTDCVGISIPGTAYAYTNASGGAGSTTYFMAQNVYYIQDNTLKCGRAGSTVQQPLIANVADMQLSFGIADSIASTTVTGYLNAEGVESSAVGPLAGKSQAERWALVRTVRICVLMISTTAVAQDTATQYHDCSGALVNTPADLKLRRSYATTVVLRNPKV